MTHSHPITSGTRGTVEQSAVERNIYGNLQDPWGMLQRASQGALPYTCTQPTHQSSAHPISIHQDLYRFIKESIYIRVNNPTLNRNIVKF